MSLELEKVVQWHSYQSSPTGKTNHPGDLKQNEIQETGYAATAQNPQEMVKEPGD